MWTKEGIRELNEARLRTDVLLPLFKAMGYLDVFEHHGGSQELGKDIVMWERDPLRGRVNYAVVAKAERISGRADSAGGTAGTVATQIAQAFRTPYLDPRTGESRGVHHVLVVSSQEIKKEAVAALQSSVLLPPGAQFTTIDGGMLWDLVCQHLPAAALGDIVRAGNVLNGFDSDYGVDAVVRGGQAEFHLTPKHPGAPPIRFQIHSPESSEGSEARRVLDAHRRTGAPAVIDGRLLTMEVPDSLRPLLSGPIERVELHQNVDALLPLRWRIDCESPAGTHSLRFELRVERLGSELITLTNERDRHLPLLMKVTLEPGTRRVCAKFSFREGRHSVARTLEAARFVTAAAEGTAVRAVDEDTGLPVFSHDGPLGATVLSAEYITALERLEQIQRACRVTLQLPEEDLNAGDADVIARIHRAITTGRYALNVRDFKATIGREGVEQLLRLPPTQATRIAVQRDAVATLWGQDIALGPELIVFESFVVREDAIDGLKKAIDTGHDEIEVAFALPPGTGRAEQLYPKWLPAEEVDALRATYPGACD